MTSTVYLMHEFTKEKIIAGKSNVHTIDEVKVWTQTPARRTLLKIELGYFISPSCVIGKKKQNTASGKGLLREGKRELTPFCLRFSRPRSEPPLRSGWWAKPKFHRS